MVTDAANRAIMMETTLGDFGGAGFLSLGPEKLPAGAGVDVVPREKLVGKAFSASDVVGVGSGLAEGVHPTREIEVLIPSVEEATLAPGGLDDGSKSAVAAGKDRFEIAALDVMEFELDAGSGGAPVEEVPDLAEPVARCHGLPLKGGVRFRDEWGDGDIDGGGRSAGFLS